jgi:hypothetical protein
VDQGERLQKFHSQWVMAIQTEVNSIISEINKNLLDIKYEVSGTVYKLFQRSENLEKSINYYFNQVRIHLERIEVNSGRKSEVDLINAI